MIILWEEVKYLIIHAYKNLLNNITKDKHTIIVL